LNRDRDIRLAKPKLEGMLAALLLEAGRVVPLRRLAKAV
jgi:hypothetical protein